MPMKNQKPFREKNPILKFKFYVLSTVKMCILKSVSEAYLLLTAFPPSKQMSQFYTYLQYLIKMSKPVKVFT